MNNNMTKVEGFSINRNGWLGVGFTDTNFSNPNTLFVIGDLVSNQIYQFNHTSKMIIPKNLIENESFGDIKRQAYSKMDNYFYLYFEIPSNVSTTSSFIALNKNNYNNFTENLPIHTAYSQYIWEAPHCDLRSLFPGRFIAELGQYYGFTLFILFLHIVTLIVGFSVRDQEPLKSRIGLPFYMIISSYLNILSEVFLQTMNLETRMKTVCLWTAYLLYPTNLSAVVLPTIFVIRYATLININVYKLEIIQTEQAVKKLPLRYRILNYATNSVAAIIFLFVIMTFYFTLITIILISGKFECTYKSSLTVRIVYIILCATIAGICLLFLIYDYICNWKLLIRCRCKKFFIHDDPHKFRLEILPGYYCFVLLIVWGTLSNLSIVRTIIADIILFTLLFIIGGFSIFATLWRVLISYCYKNSENDELKLSDVLNDEDLCQIFYVFTKREWSYENLLCKKDILEYKWNILQRASIANLIIVKYLIVGESPLELNAPGPMMKDVITKAERGNYNELFDKLEKVVDTNLSDSFERFKISSEYNKYKKQHQTKLEIVKSNQNVGF